MPPKSLLILVEGDTDKILFDKIVKPLLKRKYHQISIQSYSNLGKVETNSTIKKSISKGDDYIFVTDMEKMQCIPGKKQEKMTEFNSIDDKSKIMIAIRKIESWYTAGISDDRYRELGLTPPMDTSKSGKGLFKQILEKRKLENKLISKIDFMEEILKNFDIEIAKQRNTSFKYFVDKHCL